MNSTKWGLLSILAFVWGSSFILMKLGLQNLTPVQMGALRIVSASVVLWLIGFKSLTKIPSYKWKYIALTALFGTFIPAFLFAYALTQINSSISSILNALTPLNTLLIGVFFFKMPALRNQYLGVLIGFLGSFLLIYDGAIHNPANNYYFSILIVIASACYAVNVNLLKKYVSDLEPLSISTGNFTIMFIPAMIVLIASGFFNLPFADETLTQTNSLYTSVSIWQSVLIVFVLGAIGTGLSNVLFFRLIQLSSPIFASFVTYLIPIVAFGWGIVFQEEISFMQLLGAAIILVGVYFSSKK